MGPCQWSRAFFSSIVINNNEVGKLWAINWRWKTAFFCVQLHFNHVVAQLHDDSQTWRRGWHSTTTARWQSNLASWVTFSHSVSTHRCRRSRATFDISVFASIQLISRSRANLFVDYCVMSAIHFRRSLPCLHKVCNPVSPCLRAHVTSNSAPFPDCPPHTVTAAYLERAHQACGLYCITACIAGDCIQRHYCSSSSSPPTSSLVAITAWFIASGHTTMRERDWSKFHHLSRSI